MRFRTVIGVLASVATVGSSASAVVINPGQTSVLIGTNSVQSPWLSVPSPGAVRVRFFVLGPPFTAIYSGDLLISLGSTVPLSEPVLVYRLENTWAEDATRRVTSISFTGYKEIRIDADFRTDLGGTDEPKRVRRSADGDTLTFEFETPIPGNVAVTKFVFGYTNGAMLAFDGTATILLQTGESVTIEGLPRPSHGVAPTLPSCEGDTNGDGVVNFSDLNGVLTNFGEECP